MSDEDRPEEIDPEDALAALRAQLDQDIALAPEMARFAAGMMRAFLEQGFGSQQALYLVACHMNQGPGEVPE